MLQTFKCPPHIIQWSHLRYLHISLSTFERVVWCITLGGNRGWKRVPTRECITLGGNLGWKRVPTRGVLFWDGKCGESRWFAYQSDPTPPGLHPTFTASYSIIQPSIGLHWFPTYWLDITLVWGIMLAICRCFLQCQTHLVWIVWALNRGKPII